MGKKIDDLRIVRNAQMIRYVLLGNSTPFGKNESPIVDLIYIIFQISGRC